VVPRRWRSHKAHCTRSGAQKQSEERQDEYASEADEISTYAAIETLAGVLGGKETQRLARKRDHEAIQGSGQAEIPAS
jgi:hypothetical protein